MVAMGVFQDFIKNAAEMVFQLQGEPVGMTREGESAKLGIAGRYLDHLAEDRMAELQNLFAQTPLGGALLAYANEEGVDMRFGEFDRNSPVYAATGGRSLIILNPHKSDDALISSLAHELRHCFQHRATDAAMITSQLPPEAALAINRLKEADAFSFQQKFCEDYAARTGNSGPLEQLFSSAQGLDRESVSGSDAQRFLGWCSHLKNSGAYDVEMMHKVAGQLDDRESGVTRTPMFSPMEGADIVVSVARKIDGCWPSNPARNDGSHYLSGISDHHLKSSALMGVRPELQPSLVTVNERYSRIFESASPAIAAPAASVAAPALSPARFS